MHSETNILDFINHNCLTHDILLTQFREDLIEGDDTLYDNLADCDDIARHFAQTQKSLC